MGGSNTCHKEKHRNFDMSKEVVLEVNVSGSSPECKAKLQHNDR
jgi:hypothetical protein